MAVSLMLVDDDAVALRAIERLLLSRGHRIATSTTSGAEAAELARELRPEVVVTDLDMPGFDGVSTTRAVRELGLDIPVIVYSGSVDQGAAARCIDAGASGFVNKGVPISILFLAIERAAAGSSA